MVLLQGLAFTEIAHRNRRFGAEGDSERASNGRLEAAARGAIAVLPELGARGRDLAGDAQERRRREGEGAVAVAGGGWGRRGGSVQVRVGSEAEVEAEIWALSLGSGLEGYKWR